MNRKRGSLALRFSSIAQPYFFPRIQGGGWMTAVLVVLLLGFLFSVLLLFVAAITELGSRFAPVLTATVAPGLTAEIARAYRSHAWLLLPGMLALAVVVFAAVRHHLKTRWLAWSLLAVVLCLSLSVTGINVALSYIGNYFTNALVGKKQGLAYTFVAVYFGAFVVGIPLVAFYGYVQDYMGMRWREWMTGEFLGRYFRNRSYYEIEASGQIDNPDQRIMEDIRSFTRTSLAFLLIVLGSIMDLISFTGILWSKSTLLVVVVLAYSLVGTILTVVLGRRLVRLNFNQLRYEADFRYSLVRVRDNSESIAFYQGERPESGQITHRFAEVLRNFGLLIGWQRNLSFFTTAYSYLPVVLPFLVLFPQYFKGRIEYGDMVQANFAFTQVYAALSLIVSQINQITNFAAGIDRLSTFSDALEPRGRHVASEIRSETAEGFALRGVTLMTPNRARTLIRGLTVEMRDGDALLIVGQSGVGKSSLLRAVAGLWTQGDGVIRRPLPDDVFFLPQKPYMLLGSLRDQLLYPGQQGEVSDDALREVLRSVRLEDLLERVGGLDVELDWADILSLGEQQRLAFARLFVNHRRFAVLDEASSALGIGDESRLYDRLRQMSIRYISVGHRSSLLDYHNRVLEIVGADAWRVLSADEYRERMSERAG